MFFALLVNLKGQVNKIMYTPDFVFEEGIYLSFEEFKNNNPSIKKYAIVASRSLMNDLVYGDEKIKYIQYVDAAGQQQKLKRKEIWGICEDGYISVRIGEEFHETKIIGAISYMVKIVTNDLYLNPVWYPNPNPTPSSSIRVVYKHLLDFETGKISKYDLYNLSQILKRDSVLFEEFNAIGFTHKRKKQMFQYLKTYNERNPAYFGIERENVFDKTSARPIEFK
jgi:hypothetical protein